MKKALPLIVLATCSGNALAADYGVGLSVQSNDAWIYAPIDITPRFRIEPSIRFVSSDSDWWQSQSDGLFGRASTSYRSEAETRELAIGVFGLSTVGESVRIYYGARGAYIDAESTLRIATDFGTIEEVDEQKSSGDGYRISPTLGFEYLINSRFSIGGEAEWFYRKFDSEGSRTGPLVDTAGGTSKTNGTDTRLIVRFRF